MVLKMITVHVKPGHWDQYCAAQKVWNRETRSAPGYLGGFCGRSCPGHNVAQLVFFWRSRADLDEWMATDHDRIADLAKADEHYERIETQVLDAALPGPTLPPGLLSENTFEAADPQFWSEAYRATAALRTALRLRLFEHLSGEARALTDIAAASSVDPEVLRHLLRALCAMGLVVREGNGWANSGLAARTLVESAPAYQGDIVLHNSQPNYVARMLAYGEQLGLPPDEDEPQEYHARFLRAMANTAGGGQADALVDALDLTSCKTMLDIGGATGPYSIALCLAHPDLHSQILDLEETIPFAEKAVAQAGLIDRIDVRAHNYEEGPFPRPVDVALLSNVLRGESREMVADILQRARTALTVGGRVVVHDHFPEDAPANPGLRASLFGLHLVDKSNYTMDEMAAAVAQAGFRVIRKERLTRSVVMNGIVEGLR